MTGSNLKTQKLGAAWSPLMISATPTEKQIQGVGNRQTGSCPAQYTFAEAKGQGSQHKCRKLRKR